MPAPSTDPASADPGAARLAPSILNRFTGTKAYHRIALSLLATDGAKYVADAAKAFWLLDIIASTQHLAEMHAAGDFQVWTLEVDPATRSAIVAAGDGNGHQLYTQKVRYTDFPLPKLKLYCVLGDRGPVVMLPSEY